MHYICMFHATHLINVSTSCLLMPQTAKLIKYTKQGYKQKTANAIYFKGNDTRCVHRLRLSCFARITYNAKLSYTKRKNLPRCRQINNRISHLQKHSGKQLVYLNEQKL